MYKRIILIVLSSNVALFSCKKQSEINFDFPAKPEKSATGASSKLEEVLSKYAPKAEQFSVNAQSGGSFVSAKGTQYATAPNSFVKKDGSPVTGSVKLVVEEIFNAGDMILKDKPTVAANGGILESFGEFKVDAIQGNDTLVLQKGAQLNVVVPVVGNPRDSVVNGVANAIPLWNGDTTIAWSTSGYDYDNNYVTITSQIPAKKGIEWTPVADVASQTNTSMSFVIKKLGSWVNCDVLYPVNNKVTVLGYFTNVFDDRVSSEGYQSVEPNMLFFKLKGKNTVIKLYNRIFNAIPGKQGFLSYQNAFGIGMEGTFLALVYKDGKFYASSKDVTIGAPASGKNYFGIDFVLNEVNETEMLALVTAMGSK